jgi:anaerobic selenocysteine-containing dehydrogenase
MIAIILKEGMCNRDYIESHVNGFQQILPWFDGFDVKAALKVCELEYDQVFRVCREFTRRQSCLRDDLGILMNRHSGFVSYLLVILLAICGRIGVPGGDYLMGGKMYSDPKDPKTWWTAETNIPAIAGMFPPNVMPEEINNDRPERLRAAFVLGANPLRSYADTTAYEEAFRRLELLVVTEIAMSETAALAHYVLPCRTTYESWNPAPMDMAIPSKTSRGFLNVYARLRQPVVQAEGEQKETGEIFTLLADAMGLIPALPDSLYQAAASGNLRTYRDALVGYLMEHPENMMKVPYIAAKTLGSVIGSAYLASYFTGFLQRSTVKQEEAAKAGFEAGPEQGMALYHAIIDHPEGVLVGVQDLGKNLGRLATKDRKINLYTAEAEDWIREINPAEEEKRLKLDALFPLILMAGRHIDTNANTMMRDPAWNKGRRACTLAMNPADAEKFGFSDKQMVKVITEAGEETIEVEVTDDARKGQVVIPHGFGLVYNGVKYGANVNRLAKNTNRDRFGTPMHRYVPCRVEAI